MQERMAQTMSVLVSAFNKMWRERFRRVLANVYIILDSNFCQDIYLPLSQQGYFLSLSLKKFVLLRQKKSQLLSFGELTISS